jgi:hypothetical protein
MKPNRSATGAWKVQCATSASRSMMRSKLPRKSRSDVHWAVRGGSAQHPTINAVDRDWPDAMSGSTPC